MSTQFASFSATEPLLQDTPSVRILNDSNSLTIVTVGGNIVVNQGISEPAILALVEALRISGQVQASSEAEEGEVDEDLVERLIQDIKAARRRLDCDLAGKLLSNLQRSFDRFGNRWSKSLRIEAILLLAEEEKAMVSRLRMEGRQFDLTRFQKLMKELRDA